MMPDKTYSPQTPVWVKWLMLSVVAVVLGAGIAKLGIMGPLLLMGIPIAIAVCGLVFWRPQYGLYIVLVFSFLVNGLTRYVPAPLGTISDGLLALTLVAILLKSRSLPVSQGNHPFFWIFVVWFIYTVLELFNPIALSREAWFYSVRGVSIYIMLGIMLSLVLFSHRKQLDNFIKIWLGLSVFAALWAIKQKTIGPDYAELHWLETGGKITHIIQGQLRAFSFYSDAGQFGAAIGHAGLAALILGTGEENRRRKIVLFAICALCFYGMIISGTRGALFVPIAGYMVFLVTSKNFRLFGIGFFVGAVVFGLLKFTTVGQSNYNIRRMRSAFDSEDASLLVRKENQAKLAIFLADKPFGGGMGSGGSIGQKFTPDSYLASIPFDSWYVKIWVETGIVGLCLHLATIAFIAIYAFFPVYNCKNRTLKFKLMALYCGFIGIAVASYGNQIFGQSPTVFVLAISIAFLGLTKKLEAEHA